MRETDTSRLTTLEFPDEFVLFDLEYTAWENSQARNWSGQGEHREIIQLGAIRIAASDLSETDSFLEYVRPQKNPLLSQFITDLTGITQHDIDTKALSFRNALDKFEIFIADTPSYCWGRDIEVLQENSMLLNTSLRIPNDQLMNIRELLAPTFLKAGVDTKLYSSGTLIQAFSESPRLAAHDALNDMRNLLEAFRELKTRLENKTEN